MAFSPTANQDRINAEDQPLEDKFWAAGGMGHNLARMIDQGRQSTLITAKEVDDAATAQHVVQRQIDAKKARALRSNYRSAAATGFLNNGAAPGLAANTPVSNDPNGNLNTRLGQ